MFVETGQTKRPSYLELTASSFSPSRSCFKGCLERRGKSGGFDIEKFLFKTPFSPSCSSGGCYKADSPKWMTG